MSLLCHLSFREDPPPPQRQRNLLYVPSPRLRRQVSIDIESIPEEVNFKSMSKSSSSSSSSSEESDNDELNKTASRVKGILSAPSSPRRKAVSFNFQEEKRQKILTPLVKLESAEGVEVILVKSNLNRSASLNHQRTQNLVKRVKVTDL